MEHFISTHGPQIIETAIALIVFIALRYGVRYAKQAMVVKAMAKSSESREVGRIVDLLLILVAGVVFTAIWGVKQSELLIFATSVITVLGIGFFAEMSILSNITAFLVLFFQHPVKVGDRIMINDGTADIEGELVDLTYFFAHIRKDSGSTVTIPNAVLLKSPFTITPSGSPGK
ncbi:MAG: mechanosensitive ion channel [Flavobacteriales bacterium]|nr:mechanosensitive ion channel [Flavobacteriales bacterium]